MPIDIQQKGKPVAGANGHFLLELRQGDILLAIAQQNMGDCGKQ